MHSEVSQNFTMHSEVTISQLEAMLPDAVPQEEVREWERDLNQRRVWRPCVKDEKIEKKQEHKHPLDASVSKQQ
jgi:hypothetical protein